MLPQIIPGNSLVADPAQPYRSLSRHGVEFLNKFEGSTCPVGSYVLHRRLLCHNLTATEAPLSSAANLTDMYPQAGILENLTLVDTPGILSGEKQTSGRGYDACQIIAWYDST